MMVKPLVTFGDPESLMRSYLVAEFAARGEAWKPATITTAFPTSALSKPNGTHVQIEAEVGNVEDFPVTERAQVRFTCYAAPGERTIVKQLASLTQGLVLSHPGDSVVVGTRPQIGRSDVVTDPATKNLMCWFTAWIDLKATQLAS